MLILAEICGNMSENVRKVYIILIDLTFYGKVHEMIVKSKIVHA